MKTTAKWALALLVLAGGSFYAGYEWRNFAVMLGALAFFLTAVSLLVKPARTALTVLVSVCVALGLAELGLDMLPFNARSVHFSPSDKPYWSRSDLGATPIPGRHTTRKFDPDGKVIYDATYTIGDDGFRVTPGQPATFSQRVNFLGDSVTFGEGLNDDQTLVAQVQRLLPGVMLKNFGMHGYGMHQALAILQSPRDTSGQVNFVLTFPGHAERSACLPAFSMGSPRYVMQADGKLQRSGVCGGISYYPLARVLSLSKVYGLVKTALHGNKRQIDDDFKLYLALLRDIVKLSASRNQTVVVGFLRDQDDYFASSSYSNQQIVDAIKALNVQVIDLTLADKSENVDPKYVLSRYDPHPSAAGDALRGPMVADVLRKALASK